MYGLFRCMRCMDALDILQYVCMDGQNCGMGLPHAKPISSLMKNCIVFRPSGVVGENS